MFWSKKESENTCLSRAFHVFASIGTIEITFPKQRCQYLSSDASVASSEQVCDKSASVGASEMERRFKRESQFKLQSFRLSIAPQNRQPKAERRFSCFVVLERLV